MIDQTPEGLLRAWAKAYRDTPEHRFPSDPDAEFFPVDLEYAANEIERLRGVAQPSPRCDVCGSGDTMTICEGCWTRQPLQRPLAYRLDHPAMGIELSISEPDKDWAARGWIVTPLVASPAQSSWQPDLTAGMKGAMEIVGNMRQSEAGLFDPMHSGQRGEDRSNALYDAYCAIRRDSQVTSTQSRTAED